MFPEDVTPYTSFDLDEESIPLLLIFYKELFHPKIDYDPLQLGLRLASVALQTDDAIRLLYVLLSGKRRSFVNCAGKACIETVQDPFAHSRVGGLKRNLVLNMLEELALITEWHPNHDPKETAAETILNPRKTSSKFPGGFGSFIVLPHHALKTFDDDPAATLATSYNLARIVVHELGHAISHAVDGSQDPEVFFPGQNFSELGYSLEQVAFGGLVDPINIGKMPYAYAGQKNAQIERVMTWEQWPSEKFARKYLKEDWQIGIRDAKAMTEDFEAEDPIVLPFKNVWQVFQKSFWGVTMPEKGKKAFEIGGEVKRLHKRSKCGCCKHNRS